MLPVQPPPTSTAYVSHPDKNHVYGRGVEFPGFMLKGFADAGLDGIYERRAEEEFSLVGPDLDGNLVRTPTYWNLQTPEDRPVFLYWQYYKDHHSICARFLGDADSTDYWALVKSGRVADRGPGLAFFKHEENIWYELRESRFERCLITYMPLSEDQVRQLKSGPALHVRAGGRHNHMPVAKTPPSPGLIARTPTFRNLPRTPAPVIPRTPGGFTPAAASATSPVIKHEAVPLVKSEKLETRQELLSNAYDILHGNLEALRKAARKKKNEDGAPHEPSPQKVAKREPDATKELIAVKKEIKVISVADSDDEGDGEPCVASKEAEDDMLQARLDALLVGVSSSD